MVEITWNHVSQIQIRNRWEEKLISGWFRIEIKRRAKIIWDRSYRSGVSYGEKEIKLNGWFEKKIWEAKSLVRPSLK